VPPSPPALLPAGGRRRWIRIGLAAAVALLLLAGGGWVALAVRGAAAPARARLRPAGAPAAGAPAPGSPDGAWVVAEGAGGFAGYRVRERIANVAAPSEVVARSPGVTGEVTIAGGTLSGASVNVDMTRLESGEPPRDQQMRDRGLETASYPTAAFRLTRPVPLGPVAVGRVLDLRLPGELTLRNVTRPVEFPVQARWDGGAVQVAGSLQIRRSDFQLQVPELVGFKIEDAGVVELELTLVRKGATRALAGPPSTLGHHPGRPGPLSEAGPPCRRGAAPPAGGGRLLFATPAGDLEDVWAVRADGTGAAPVLHAPEGETEPDWAPDGRRIAYTRQEGGEAPPYVYVADAGGRGRRDVSAGTPTTQPDWAPDGRRLVAVSGEGDGGGEGLEVLDARGGTPRQLATPTADSQPDWSPDGRSIAFAAYGGPSNEDVAVIRPDGSGFERLTTAPGYEYSPAWSPDGRRIAYVADGAVHVMLADGSGDRRVTKGPRDGAPAWSPDGRRLSFLRDGSIFVARADGSGAACLPVGRPVTSAAKWQP
jgi:polyisoprenoid-binding protein YceI